MNPGGSSYGTAAGASYSEAMRGYSCAMAGSETSRKTRGAHTHQRAELPGELCRREALAESMYYAWSKEFLKAGKRRLAGDTARAATTDEVKSLRHE
jgi:hypothetical protein